MYIDLETVWRVVRVVHDPRTSTLRRALFMDGILGLFAGLNGLNRAGELVDAVRHPEVASVSVGRPIYIVAAPRSGTTFLHRLMCLDPQFTALTVLEQALHTVTLTRAIEKLRSEGGPLGWLFEAWRTGVDRFSFAGWEGLHDTSIDAPEEDEAIWGLAAASVSLWFILPEPERLRHLAFVDRWPQDKRRALAEHYRSVLQRHLYMNPGRTLLGKNVLAPGRMRTLLEAVPEARFVHIARHPYEAVASTLSLFTIPWGVSAPDVRRDGSEARALAELMVDYYRALHEQSVSSPVQDGGRFYSVRYGRLMEEPLHHVDECYRLFGLEMGDGVREAMERELVEHADYRSAHRYSLEQFGLSEDWVYERLGDLFEHYGFER